ncbi:hypothetical protein F5141DRAFT_1094841 [Pisolithus sp. B1]|nr:hypothetical protein F5141DRAFT_1094841 [Pisolithus sp. B1]
MYALLCLILSCLSLTSLFPVKTYVYYMHYSGDASTIKFPVGAVWILDTLHVAFMCHVLYYYLIINYGVLTSLEYDVWSSSLFSLELLPADDIWQVVSCTLVHLSARH